MHLKGTLWLGVLLAVLSPATRCQSFRVPRKPGYAIFEKHLGPITFKRFDIPSAQQHRISLKIGIKQQGIESILQKLYEISTPHSSSYGQHLTLEKLLPLLAPSNQSILLLQRWLGDQGIEERRIRWSRARDWATIDNLPLPQVEDLLNTKYFYFKNAQGNLLVRTEEYSLPEVLHAHVDLVQPTTMFGVPHEQRSTIANVQEMLSHSGSVRIVSDSLPGSCIDPGAVSNRCLRELYKTHDYFPKAQGNQIGITGYLGEVASYPDLKVFMGQERPEQTKFNFSIVEINGGTKNQSIAVEVANPKLGVEANLDVQTTMGFTTPGVSNVFYSVGGSPPFKPDASEPINTNEPYLDWVEYVSSQEDERIPKVITTSYGDSEQTVPESYARRVCGQFGALGARGVSLLFSSGDGGVGANAASDCVTNDGKNTTRFLPSFPASCPFVTVVGATEGFSPEVPASRLGIAGYPTGAGFSNYFSRPDYQHSQVEDYLAKLDGEFDGLFSKKGRGYPDVSAQGAKYIIIKNGQRLLVGGTSAACPTFASVVALLNDYRLSLGKGPMGFLNPWLYSVGFQGLDDVTLGSATGCGTRGFPAQKGWDPATGLGTPNFKKLQRLVGKPE